MGETIRSVMIGSLGILAGFAVGVTAGLLLAPRSGEQTRRQLQRLGQEAGERAREVMHEVREAAADVLQRAETVVGVNHEQR